jgi:TetR/AcrR family transcriptional regulator, repressor for uid operon
MPRPKSPALTAERREQILQAAAACFRRDGFRGASVNAICREAGISPGHLYYYFAAKEALIEAIAASDLAKLRAFLAKHDTHRAMVDLLTITETGAAPAGILLEGSLALEIFAEGTRNPKVRAVLQQHYAALKADFVALIERAQVRGEVRTDYPPEHIAMLFGLLFEGMNVVGAVDRAHLHADLHRLIGELLDGVLTKR